MPIEPPVKQAVAFIDGQNLFHSVKDAFGYTYPNFDTNRLAEFICNSKGWQIAQVRFYTGVPDAGDNVFWNHFWSAKLAHMGRQGILTYSRPLRYQNKLVTLPDGSQQSMLIGQEKGIDVRIPLDAVRLVLDGACNVVILFSQD